MKTKHLMVVWICSISCIIGIIIWYFLRLNKTNKISQVEIFEKDIECQKYKESYTQRAKRFAALDGDPIWITIFYSPIENKKLKINT